MRRVIDISSYLIRTFKAKFIRDNWRFNCPFCSDGNGHFGVSLAKGVVSCFKCGYKNSVIGFLCDYEAESITNIFRMLQEYPRIVPPPPKRIEPRAHRFSLGDIGYVPLWVYNRESLWKLGKAYAAKRGIRSEEELKKLQIGYASGEKYYGRLIIPFVENEEVVYFVGRKFIGPGPKYQNPSKEEIGFGKGEVVFNLDRASLFDSITVCEGVFDAIAVGPNAVALLGKTISDTQFVKIILSGCNRVTVMLDADATDYLMDMANEFSQVLPTFVIILKDGDPASNRKNLSKLKPQPFSLQTYLDMKMHKKRGRTTK